MLHNCQTWTTSQPDVCFLDHLRYFRAVLQLCATGSHDFQTVLVHIFTVHAEEYLDSNLKEYMTERISPQRLRQNVRFQKVWAT